MENYVIKVWLNQGRAYHPWIVEVRATRYKDSQEFSGKSLKSLLLKAEQWIQEK